MTNLLEMRGISKAFAGVKALSDVNLTVRQGEIHALVGENGAGKSTLMKVVAGLLEADEGAAELLMERIADPQGARRTIRLDTVLVERDSCGAPP